MLITIKQTITNSELIDEIEKITNIPHQQMRLTYGYLEIYKTEAKIGKKLNNYVKIEIKLKILGGK